MPKEYLTENFYSLYLKQPDDKELVLRLKNNEVAAFNTLYWKYHAALYANVMKLTRDVVLAEDTVQDVFITLWERRESLDPEQPVAGWLFVVSYNRTITQLKRAARETIQPEALDKVPIEVFDEGSDKTEVQLKLLQDATQLLSPQKRKVFELCKMQGKTYDQTAAELGISKHTVKEYLSEAVATVKKYVQQHPEQHAFLLIYTLTESFLS